MSRISKFLIFFVFFFTGISISFALSSDYNDKVSSIIGSPKEDNIINIYLFYSSTCPHCHKEIEYLNGLENSKYSGYINIYTYEVSNDIDNNEKMYRVKEEYDVTNMGVPFTVIGDKYIMGYGDGTDKKIEKILDSYILDKEIDNSYKIPILGEVDAKKSSILLIATILGLVDGFNPCAMWILLLLINMSISLKNRKKMLYVGLTFILTSGVIYCLSMLGIGFVIDLVMVGIIRSLIGIIAFILGILNIRTYIKTRHDSGCHVTSGKNRRSIIDKISKILKSNNVVVMGLSTIVLAISVNLVELACSLGFPTIFLEILSINSIIGFRKIIYIFIYVFFYLIDDLVVFLIALFTLKVEAISTKYNKYVNLVGGIIMIAMGILLVVKPEWIMLNF